MVGENQLLAGRRALSVVEALSRTQQGMSFSMLQDHMGVSAASLSRLLKMLLDEGWIELDQQGRYGVGARLMTLSRQLAGHWSEHEVIEPVIRDLALQVGHSACFARFANDAFVLTAKTEVASSFHFIDLFTKHYEMHDNGMALTLLAYVDPDTALYLLEEQVEGGDAQAFTDLLPAIREAGHHISFEGAVTRITVPVYMGGQSFVRSVVSIAALNLDPAKCDEVLDHVRSAAVEAGQRLDRNNSVARSA